MPVFQVAQLHHELNLKDELLQFYTNASEESEDGSGSPTSVHCFITLSPFIFLSRLVEAVLSASVRLLLAQVS